VGLDKFLGRVKCGMRQKCRTGQKCRARQTCRVGQKCRAGQKCGLGQWCRAGQRCRVIQKCRAVQTCRVGQKCREGQNCKVGYECRARQKCRACAREEQAQGDYTRISKSEKNTTSSRKLYTSVHWTTERFGDIGEKCRLFSPVMGTVSVVFFTVSAGDSDLQRGASCGTLSFHEDCSDEGGCDRGWIYFSGRMWYLICVRVLT